jgi:hypothetical protein
MARLPSPSGRPHLPRKAFALVFGVPVPQTDTGGQVEYTKAIGRTLVKELGKLPS